MLKVKDKRGLCFGKLLVVSLAGLCHTAKDRHHRTLWRCKCDCGNEVLLPNNYLSNKFEMSCGCLPGHSKKKVFTLIPVDMSQVIFDRGKDLVGERFGKLLVTGIGSTVTRSGRRYPCFVCKCDCDEICEVSRGNLVAGHTRSCGCLQDTYRKEGQNGANGPRWKGGRVHHKKSGYVYLHKPAHPHANKMGYVAEHRIIMEECMKRYLRPEETVHHKNGIKGDNRPDNLELRIGNHGKHQSVADLVTWAQEILARYSLDAGLDKTQEDMLQLSDTEHKRHPNGHTHECSIWDGVQQCDSSGPMATCNCGAITQKVH